MKNTCELPALMHERSVDTAIKFELTQLVEDTALPLARATSSLKTIDFSVDECQVSMCERCCGNSAACDCEVSRVQAVGSRGDGGGAAEAYCDACPACDDVCDLPDDACEPCRAKRTRLEAALRGAKKGRLPTYTMCQVARHRTASSAWLVAHKRVYDATPWIDAHPGGSASILRKAGTDCMMEHDFRSARTPDPNLSWKRWSSAPLGRQSDRQGDL